MSPALLVVLTTLGQAYLGVDLRDQQGQIVVTAVEPGSPAQQARLAKGDAIIEVNGRPVQRPREVIGMVAQMQPSQVIELRVVRGGKSYRTRATLAAAAEPKKSSFSANPRASLHGHAHPGCMKYAAPDSPIAKDYAGLTADQQPVSLCVSFAHLPLAEQEGWGKVLSFVVPSCSRAVVLDYHLPYQLPGTAIWRLDLQQLQWDVADVLTVLQAYPYDPELPFIHGDWLIAELTDTTESDAYYRLLYGSENIPANLDDFFAFWGADRARQPLGLSFGLIEDKSGVSYVGIRFIENFLTAVGGSIWLTHDVLEVKTGSDPLAAPDGNFEDDGQEAIARIPKVSIAQRIRGFLHVYLLANGDDARVEEAPADLVEDFSRFKHSAIIRNWGSCAQCHGAGINPPTRSAVQALLVAGVDLFADGQKQQGIEDFHLTGVGKEIRRNNEDYAAAVLACNGLPPETNARAFREAHEIYYAPLYLERAAGELYAAPAELRLAIAWASRRKLDLGPRAPSLLVGWGYPRTAFEADYRKLLGVLKLYRQAKADFLGHSFSKEVSPCAAA